MSGFLLYGGIPVGLVAIGFLLGTYALLDLPVDVPLLAAGFCGTFLVYRFDHMLGLAPEDRYNQPERIQWLQSHRVYVNTTTALALVGGVITVPLLDLSTLLVCLVLSLIGILYITPLLPGHKRLKTIWYAKPITITAGWVIGGVLLPVIEGGRSVTQPVLVLLLYRFLFVLPNTIIADWPDRFGDARSGLSTVANRLSISQLRFLCAFLLLIVISGAITLYFYRMVPELILVDVIGPGLLLAAVLKPLSEEKWFFGFVIDMIIGWPVTTALYTALIGQ